jgi:HD-GYP domain-containing protein (c-di-GMP phosphodiesterase class II)
MDHPAPDIRSFDAVKALAFIGDLSMGQPTDHSLRTAWLALQLAHASGFDDDSRHAVAEASLLRWSGCTANASGFAQVLGDDVGGREAMLAAQPGWAAPLDAHGGLEVAVTPLVQIHCEVSGEVASMLKLAPGTELALRHIFETFDGHGLPGHLDHDAIPAPVPVIALAGDLEIFHRTYGLEHALSVIAQRADARYPKALAEPLSRMATTWLSQLDRLSPAQLDDALLTPAMRETAAPELIADVIDLKLPWMTGYSRSCAATAAACCERLGVGTEIRNRVYLATLIHGLGRAAVPNAIWNTATSLSSSSWEKLRLVPYWASRAGKQSSALERASELASYAYERLDGSGYFRGLGSHAIGLEARVIAASLAWVALRSARPWRAAFSAAAATALLREEAGQGRFDVDIVEALVSSSPQQGQRYRVSDIRLSSREMDVLRSISRGASNKEAARELALSPSTVGTHVESIFRKLGCSTRAAATLKGASLGFL